eukprot:scaffold16044_cov67-Phaeocystis_antarctica.AAC.7
MFTLGITVTSKRSPAGFSFIAGSLVSCELCSIPERGTCFNLVYPYGFTALSDSESRKVKYFRTCEKQELRHLQSAECLPKPVARAGRAFVCRVPEVAVSRFFLPKLEPRVWQPR